MQRGRILWILKALVVLLLLLAVVYARVVLESQKNFFEAESKLRQNRKHGAVYHFQAAAAWTCPFNPYEKKSHDRLWQIGRKAELTGDMDLALEAYRAIRTSIMGSRSFYTPGVEVLRAADERISVLMAARPHAPAFKQTGEDELQRLHYGKLADSTQPDPLWVMILIVGILLWTGAVGDFVFSGLGPGLKVLRGPLLRTGVVFALGMGLWITAMVMA
jgi:hypothetical protein